MDKSVSQSIFPKLLLKGFSGFKDANSNNDIATIPASRRSYRIPRTKAFTVPRMVWPEILKAKKTTNRSMVIIASSIREMTISQRIFLGALLNNPDTLLIRKLLEINLAISDIKMIFLRVRVLYKFIFYNNINAKKWKNSLSLNAPIFLNEPDQSEYVSADGLFI